jgi:hypothetical protein
MGMWAVKESSARLRRVKRTYWREGACVEDGRGSSAEWLEIPAIQDKEVESSDKDRFGHRDLELALRGLIESGDREPPYSIGLLGGWGTGKSTVRALYESKLDDDPSRKRRIYRVSFNAWRFGGKDQDVRRALLRHIYLAIGGDDSRLRDELYRQVQRSSTEKRPRSQIIADIKALWEAVGVQLLILYGVAIIVGAVLIYGFGIQADFLRTILLALLLATPPVLARYVLNPIPWRANVTRIELPSTTAEQYEEFFKGELARFKRGESGVPDSANYDRIVVFVDDLDRLPAEEMVDGLDAVRGFMDLPEEVWYSPGLIFVVSCDEGKVAEALADRKRRLSPELPATISSKDDARRYLDRIFQFRLEVPPLPKRDMRSYAKTRLTEDLSIVAKDLTNREYSLDEVVDRMIHPGVGEPRSAIHILNAFCRGWWLAHHRERTGGAERAGGLIEGAVTGHPQTLAALSALQVGFPEFYDDLQRHPDLLDAFSRVFLDRTSIDEQPVGLHDVLREYQVQSVEGSEIEVKAEHRELRTFVAGLRGMRRPGNLRPLLELSQDQLARELGPRGEALRNAFVSADVRGVLESLGRANDGRQLSPAEISLLRDVEEDTRRETTSRRDNGAVVISELSDRLPPERADSLLSPLARRIVDSREVRSRIGVTSMSALLPQLRPDDHRDTAGALVADLLRPGGEEILLQTESLEQPSLDTAIEMVREGVPRILRTRQEARLSPEADRLLLTWLTERNISVPRDSFQLPFSELEQWMNQHEDDLLESLGSNYTAQLVDAAREDRVPEPFMDDALRRSTMVFEGLAAEGGQQSTSTLWQQLTVFVSAPQPRVARAGWAFAAAHVATADPEGLNALILGLATRISEALEVPDDRGLEIGYAGEALVTMCNARAENLNDNALERISTLAVEWSR